MLLEGLGFRYSDFDRHWGGGLSADPCHTTVRTGPYTAVRVSYTDFFEATFGELRVVVSTTRQLSSPPAQRCLEGGKAPSGQRANACNRPTSLDIHRLFRNREVLCFLVPDPEKGNL